MTSFIHLTSSANGSLGRNAISAPTAMTRTTATDAETTGQNRAIRRAVVVSSIVMISG
jgi:hypothetical protein